ncbi:WD40-repeat-containing domain protein [Suillus spraguei]|nr:WD40-repeat-containing domain protein [Suillus spraguei]
MSSCVKTSTPRQTMRGHTGWVNAVVHLPDRRHIITDLESGAQIGEEWRDKNDAVWSMALSPNGKIIASGSGGSDQKVRLWDVGTRKVIANWTGHTDAVCALCWSADGELIASGSWGGTARVWDVTGHQWVYAVTYSPDSSRLATGGDTDDAVKIWDVKTGELFTTLHHERMVYSLAWTSDGQKLISGSLGPIRIFDTATWQQIAILDGHSKWVNAISLAQNNRLLASVSDDVACLWNLDTNLQVGPPLQHDKILTSVAFSLDGKVLATGCKNENAYTWDVHAILKKADLEDLLPSIPNINVPTRKPLVNGNSTRRPPIQVGRIPQGFFNGMQNGTQSPATHGTRPRSPAQHPRITRAPLSERFSSLFHNSHSYTDGATELQQRPRRSIFSHQGPRIIEVSSVQDRKALVVARPRQKKHQQAQSHSQGSSTTNTAMPGARPAPSKLTRSLARLVLFLCCASPQYVGGNVQQTQQQSQGQAQTHATSSQTQHHQGQPQQPQVQASSSQTQPATSTSAPPTALNAHTTTQGATNG